MPVYHTASVAALHHLFGSYSQTGDGQITGDYKAPFVRFKKLDETELYPAKPLVFSEPRSKSIKEITSPLRRVQLQLSSPFPG